MHFRGAALHLFFRDPAIELERRGAFLRRPGEHAEPFEPDLADEVERLLEITLTLAGESHDKAGTQGNPRNSLPYPVEQFNHRGPSHPPPHLLQYAVGAALDRQIEIGNDPE